MTYDNKSTRWFRKLFHFHKILNEKFPPYLFDFILNLNITVGKTRSSNNVPPINVKQDVFKNSFLPSVVSEWKQHESKFRNSRGHSNFLFQKNLWNFSRLFANSIFNIHNPYEIKLLTRCRLGFSHLHDHKFRYCFQDTLGPFYSFKKILLKFFLYCTNFYIPWQIPFQNIKNMDEQTHH